MVEYITVSQLTAATCQSGRTIETPRLFPELSNPPPGVRKHHSLTSNYYLLHALHHWVQRPWVRIAEGAAVPRLVILNGPPVCPPPGGPFGHLTWVANVRRFRPPHIFHKRIGGYLSQPSKGGHRPSLERSGLPRRQCAPPQFHIYRAGSRIIPRTTQCLVKGNNLPKNICRGCTLQAFIFSFILILTADKHS